MNRTLRLPALIVLPLLLVAGLVIQSRDDGPSGSDVRLSELTATASAPGTPSSTWYCAAGSATGATSGEGAGPAEQVVAISNASDTDATGIVTLFPEGGAPKAVPITVAAHSRSDLKVSDQVKAPWAAALVETTGGEVSVAHDLVGPTGHSVSDCASSPSAEWYFPAGSSRVGQSEMYLALFNPFPGEATVDLSFDTDNGIRSPQDYQGIVVPGGSVVVKKVSEGVTETDLVATNVSVRNGRIVAEQVQTFAGRDNGPKGLTATVGASTPAPVWTFPMSAPADVDAAETVAVFNPGGTDTDVLVQVQLDDPGVNGTVEPFEVTVPAHRATVIDLRSDQRVPPGVPHWVIVRTVDGSDIVAERTLTGGGSKGVSYTIGLPVVATRWLATVAANSQPTSQLAIVNPSATDTATVSVRGIGGGSVTDIPGATDLTIAPGDWVVIDLTQAGLAAGSSVEVVSDVGVVVGQWMAFAAPTDIATPVGVPVVGTQSLPASVVDPTVATGGDLGGDLAPAPPVPGPDATEAPLEAGDDSSSTTTTTTAAGA
jgi:hypothetical protein